MLYNQRERAKERAKAEARGENFWTPAFSEKVRRRLLYALGEVAGGHQVDVLERARQLILSAEGVPYLERYGPNVTPAEDFFGHFMGCRDDVMPTAVEALYSATQAFGVGNPNLFVPTIDVDLFGRKVQEILEQERVAFDFARGEMRSVKSKELHQEVIEPAMKLLHDPKFSEVEKAYQNALEEISNGKPGNAITDAGTALQETLKALGCEGDTLGSLIKSAKTNKLLARHDDRMTEAIESVMVSAAALRNDKSDSHWADKATKEDAWFIIHIVGALIVRLVGANAR